ncbi:hypothetical protein [Novosphingobium arvoryzae]|uniref:DUF5655 domain-containing protein n=1 Tax=Novosphingobium arvoryzae TaxID=1256514 RepID=A0A918VCE0_9SPHN|nr:hypothetical protein [Novosphingobium arvoryzae]GGZ86406.1 hypothetical protein GCM10011617_01240 [Novosphingobium arvoryzae]
MKLFKQNQNKLVEFSPTPFELEKDIQSLIESNVSSLFNLQMVCSEFTIGSYRLDTLCFDEDNAAFVIIEYKKGNSYSVIDQGYSYLSTMLQNKADFILEYNEKTEKTLKKDQVDWSQSRVIFISPSFNSYQKNSVNFKDMPFELWEIKRFNNDIISLVQHLPTSKEKIENITASGSVISSVNAEIEVTDEAEHVSKTSAQCAEVWEGLKEYFGNLEDTSCSSKKHYIRVNKGSTAICYVYFRKTSLMISIVRGTLYPDGTKSKNYIEIDDPKGVGAAKEFTWRNGNKGHEYQFSVTTPKDVEYATLLLKQKYDSI